jgi:hypothetical protein
MIRATRPIPKLVAVHFAAELASMAVQDFVAQPHISRGEDKKSESGTGTVSMY